MKHGMVLCRGGVGRFLLGNILPDLWEHLPVSWSQCRLQVLNSYLSLGCHLFIHHCAVGKSLVSARQSWMTCA